MAARLGGIGWWSVQILCLGASAALGSGCGGGGGGAPTADSLLVSDSTVHLALAQLASDSFQVPANCVGAVLISCPAGMPGPPVALVAERVSDSAWSASGDLYDFSLNVKLNTVSDIPLATLGVQCGLAIDTRSGTRADLTVYGTALFKARGVDSLIDELDIAVTDLAGLEAADVTLNGGLSCSSLSLGLSAVLGVIQSSLVTVVRLCAAPGPAVFETCPAMVARRRDE